MRYQGTWESVSQHEVPQWFHDAKLGIFYHWGLYSVPAWAPHVDSVDEIMRKAGPRGMYQSNPYSEWYANSYRVKGSPTWQHHREHYGENDYDLFRDMFDRASADADLGALADTAKEAGADYVVLTTKHHDGFTLWPSALTHPVKGRYSAKRDLVGEFAAAVRDRGMRFGAYYSGGYDWPFNGALMTTLADSGLAMPADPAYTAYAEQHVRELIERTEPSILWNDIGWPGGGSLASLFADYYNAVPEGVVNNRWAEGPARRTALTRSYDRVMGAFFSTIWPLLPASVRKLNFPGSPHVDYTTPEYHSYDSIQEKPWELTRGIGRSFALNTNEGPEEYLTLDEVVFSLADATSKNGRLLLGLGPDAAGVVPEEQRRITAALGAWLARNNEAFAGTRPYTRAEGTRAEVRYTERGDTLYAIAFEAPGRVLVLDVAATGQTVRLLGVGRGAGDGRGEGGGAGVAGSADAGSVGPELDTRAVDGRLAVRLPERLPEAPAYVLSITGVNAETAETVSPR